MVKIGQIVSSSLVVGHHQGSKYFQILINIFQHFHVDLLTFEREQVQLSVIIWVVECLNDKYQDILWKCVRSPADIEDYILFSVGFCWFCWLLVVFVGFLVVFAFWRRECSFSLLLQVSQCVYTNLFKLWKLGNQLENSLLFCPLHQSSDIRGQRLTFAQAKDNQPDFKITKSNILQIRIFRKTMLL